MMKSAMSFEAEVRGSSRHEPPSRPIRLTAADEVEFLLAMEAYKRSSGRMFPTWSEILEVLRSLGYAKRIWRPVGLWAPIPTSLPGIQAVPGAEADDMMGILGWSSRVETPVGP